MTPKIRALVELSRVSNLPTIWTNCLAAWVLADGTFDWHFIPLLVGASLIYSAGMLLNDAADFEWDKLHRPERPIPRGAISRKAAYGFSIGGLVLGVMLFALAGVWVIWALLLVAAVVVYNVTHKRWLPAIFVMGSCRFLLYLCAGSAADGWFPPFLVWVWGIALGVYTVGVTHVARGEASDAKANLLGLGLLAAPLVAGLFALVQRKSSDGVMAMICLLLLAGWTAWAVIQMRGDAEGRIGSGVSKLLAGIILIDAAAVAPAYGWLGLAMVVMLPSVLLIQRKVAAT